VDSHNKEGMERDSLNFRSTCFALDLAHEQGNSQQRSKRPERAQRENLPEILARVLPLSQSDREDRLWNRTRTVCRSFHRLEQRACRRGGEYCHGNRLNLVLAEDVRVRMEFCEQGAETQTWDDNGGGGGDVGGGHHEDDHSSRLRNRYRQFHSLDHAESWGSEAESESD